MKIFTHQNYSYVTVVEIPKREIQKIDMCLCAQPKQSLKSFYDNCTIKPTLLCNGGFFQMSTGNTIFNYADNGTIISSVNSLKEGMGIINNELAFGNVDCGQFYDFISGYPVLIKNGQKVITDVGNEINYKARRTILGYNDSYIYLIAIEKPGMDFKQVQNLLLSLKINYAINLDGGGSTKILYNGKSLTKDWTNRALDNVIAFYLKPTIIYRVQIGAFSKKCYAENYLKEIQQLKSNIGINYSKAYIKRIGRYYKVQVGAFSKKQNAVNVVNDLKAKGYNSFITT